jgi:hypothetical protein
VRRCRFGASGAERLCALGVIGHFCAAVAEATAHVSITHSGSGSSGGPSSGGGGGGAFGLTDIMTLLCGLSIVRVRRKKVAPAHCCSSLWVRLLTNRSSDPERSLDALCAPDHCARTARELLPGRSLSFISVRKVDATVISRRRYHSCYVHHVRQAAPNTRSGP